MLDVPYTENGTTRNLEFLLNGLLPYRTYEIYVVGIDSQTANSSNTITMTTLTDRPGSPPLDILAYSTDPFTIRLTWSPPNRETRNGVITSYTIQYGRTDRRVERFHTISATLNSFRIRPPCRKTFCRKTSCRKDILLKGHLAESMWFDDYLLLQ